MGLDSIPNEKLPGVTAQYHLRTDRRGKSAILDEFTATSGHNRKYALHILAHWDRTRSVILDGKPIRLKAATRKWKPGGGRQKIYFDEAIAVLEKYGGLKGIPTENYWRRN
jgi:hypothetical protein